MPPWGEVPGSVHTVNQRWRYFTEVIPSTAFYKPVVHATRYPHT